MAAADESWHTARLYAKYVAPGMLIFYQLTC